MKNVVIFASGQGSNAENIIKYFKNHKIVKIVAIITNKADAGVITVAINNNIPNYYVSKTTLNDPSFDLQTVINIPIDLIVLAGFLLLMPKHIISKFNNCIINIHPALLPKYGGKGMHGKEVHEAVINAKEKTSGITIHYVNEIYDSGQIIFQKEYYLDQYENSNTLAANILKLEHQYLPTIIEKLLA
jgi:phosphoribosylglycinamide formyltransferase-1